MSLIIAAVLIVVSLVGAAVVAIGIPVLIGIVIHDLTQSRTVTIATASDTSLRIAAERGVARAFVIAGGAFWSIAAFAGLSSFQQTGTSSALMAAFIPAAACAATLIIGWYYERATAALLALATVAVLAWGVIYQFELGVWMIMTFALIGPMLTASVLFWLARREQDAFELATATRLELSPIFAARSTIA